MMEFPIETNPLRCRGNQWTGLYMIGITVMKVLIFFPSFSVVLQKSNIFDVLQTNTKK